MKHISVQIFTSFFLGLTALWATSCDDLTENAELPNAPYVLALGITSSGVTSYYVVTTDNLMEGKIDAVGKGIEESGYHDYEKGNNTVFSVGGLGVNYVTGITRDANGYLQQSGDFVFNDKLSGFTQVDGQTMLGMEIPAKAADGDDIVFYQVDINSISITKQINVPIAPIAEVEWPSITGMVSSGNKVYVGYIQMNPTTYATAFTDTTYVAVYNYPSMTLEKVMKDTRTGPAGSWAAFNAFLKDETGDIYVMSNSSMANGFSQATKKAAFLRIPGGTTAFDPDYFFDFEEITGGMKPAHVHYIGNGLVFAEVSTLTNQTADDRWTDKDLKCCIIDLYNKAVTDIKEIPVHNGNGGRRFTVLVDGGKVYFPVSTTDGIYIYRIDPATAVAELGARVSTTFVGGLFRID